MFDARFMPLSVAAMTACSSVGLSGSDGGKTEGGTGGTVTAKNASYSGTASAGTLSFVLANDSGLAVDALTEARVTVASGEIVFPLTCGRCTSADTWCIASGTASVRIAATNLDLTGKATLATTCKGVPATFRAASDSPGASTTDVPLTLTLKGLYGDGTKWSTTATLP